VERLTNPIRAYAWGSRDVIGALQGRAVPSDGPEAELWIGAHPADPSILDRPEGPVSLLEAIAADPQGTLGPAAAAEFGPRLPFLLKVLAAEQPLSLQAHPDAGQALAGYTAGHASYVDPYHKPELLVAVSEFAALCGFRDPKESADLLAALDLPALAPVVASLRAGAPDGLRCAVHALLTWPAGDRPAVVDAVASGAGNSLPAFAARPHSDLAARLAGQYPGDMGVVVAMLLNHVTLMPGEAIWMPAGNLHTYLYGTGVEIMAASDNVLRGGLTPKRVDVEELLRVLRFEVLADPVVRPMAVVPGVVTWPTPVREFALYRALLDEATPRVEVELGGPREVLCLRGEVRVDDGVAAVTLGPGQAAFGPATGHRLAGTGYGEVYIAALPAASGGTA
jgi:mannose-6-phosphate isomerase